ncbi:MAG: hypothetical protein IPI68_11355 [Chitinophagaceae bacterium]|nr:hypothetical protein [Chitinophagaceae bacterium]
MQSSTMFKHFIATILLSALIVWMVAFTACSENKAENTSRSPTDKQKIAAYLNEQYSLNITKILADICQAKV